MLCLAGVVFSVFIYATSNGFLLGIFRSELPEAQTSDVGCIPDAHPFMGLSIPLANIPAPLSPRFDMCIIDVVLARIAHTHNPDLVDTCITDVVLVQCLGHAPSLAPT